MNSQSGPQEESQRAVTFAAQKVATELEDQTRIRRDGKPISKIRVVSRDDARDRPYDIYKIKRTISSKDKGYVKLETINLTPVELQSPTCPQDIQNGQLMCAHLFKFKLHSLKETVEYFKNPCLDFEKVAKLLNKTPNEKPIQDDSERSLSMFGSREDEEVTRQQKEEGLPRIQLTDTSLFNVVNIRQTKLDTNTEVGRYVMQQTQEYNASAGRVCSDQAVQTPNLGLTKTMRNKETCIDVDMIDTENQNKAVQITQYQLFDQIVASNQHNSAIKETPIDHQERTPQGHYLNHLPSDVVADQIRKLGLVMERHLQQDDKRIVAMARFENPDEKINYLSKDTVDDIELDLLFSMKCDMEDRAVLTMDWHPVNKHVVAVAYGSLFLNDKIRSSTILIWNINNTTNPERIYQFKAFVICLEFSKWKPYNLLVTFGNGLIYVLEVSHRTQLCSKKHKQSVSYEDVQDVLCHVVASNSKEDRKRRTVSATWFNNDAQIDESILACKENGKVVKYTFRPPDLIDELIVRRPPQMSLHNYPLIDNQSMLNMVVEDVGLKKGDVFYIASEDGIISKISQSLKEITGVYNAHKSRLTSFEFSPLDAHLFLTSSFDGCIKIWAVMVDTPLATLENEEDPSPVVRARWSPRLFTVIISVVHTGIEVWDLTHEIKNCPYIVKKIPSDHHITDFVFAKNGVNICVGDGGGNLFIYKILTRPNLDYPNNASIPQDLLLCRTILSWNLPQQAAEYFNKLPYPWSPETNMDENEALEKDLAALKATYGGIIRDVREGNMMSLAERLEGLILDDKKADECDMGGEKRTECVKEILRKVCRMCEKEKLEGNKERRVMEMLKTIIDGEKGDIYS